MFSLNNRLPECIIKLIRTDHIPKQILAGFLVGLLGPGIITLITVNVHSEQIPITVTATKPD